MSVFPVVFLILRLCGVEENLFLDYVIFGIGSKIMLIINYLRRLEVKLLNMQW